MADKFPADKGSYLLWLFLPRGTDLTIGKLGCHHFRRGWYLYCGSAFGPGGLRARIGHHLKHSDRKHWHIDYLKSKAQIRSVWFGVGENFEHEWSRRLADYAEASYPLAGFGASDCHCCSHLIYFPRRLASNTIRNVLGDEKMICRRNVG